MSAEIIRLAERRGPSAMAREKQLAERAESILKQLEATLAELTLASLEVRGEDTSAMDDDLVCRYQAFHTAGMLEAYAKRNRGAQHIFEEKLRKRGLRPPR